MTMGVRDRRQSERTIRSRRNRRIRMSFPVTVEVPTEDGRTRVLKARTVVVSHAGATLDMDEAVPLELGVQVTPPFGGTILAEVNGGWVDRATGRPRVSIRLIDPVSWTSPERLAVPAAGARKEQVSLGVHVRVWQMLAEYTAYLNETGGGGLTLGQAAEKIMEDVFLSDVKFQDWFAAKIMEDLQAWEKVSVRATARGRARACVGAGSERG